MNSYSHLSSCNFSLISTSLSFIPPFFPMFFSGVFVFTLRRRFPKFYGLRNPRRHHAPHPPPLAAANPTRLFASCACMGGACSLLFSHAPCWNCEMWKARKAVKVTKNWMNPLESPNLLQQMENYIHLETP